MAVRDALKVSRKTFFNPRSWLGYDEVKAQTTLLWSILKALFTTPVPAREETFQQAMKRLDLTENDVKQSIKSYRTFALLFFVLGLVTFAYAFYLLFLHKTLIGWLLGLCVCALFMSQAFRFDFWSFQLRQRKLGLTYKEWKHNILGNKEAS